MFGWKSSTARADLQTVLARCAPARAASRRKSARCSRNILALRGRRVDDVMVPRADIIAVQQDISLGELIKVFESAGHSRLVVHDDTLDDPVGMVHIRDLIGYMVRRAQQRRRQRASARSRSPPGSISRPSISRCRSSAAKIIREILFVPPSMPALDLLAKMQATRIHLALVIDEYGGTDGIVSIEDVVEQIVGEIEDEHDEDETPAIVRQPDGSFLADARASSRMSWRPSDRSSTSAISATRWTRSAVIVMTRAGRAAHARRARAGPGRIRDRGARCRSAPAEEGRASRAARRSGGERDARRRDAAPTIVARRPRSAARQGIAVTAPRVAHASVACGGALLRVAARRDRVRGGRRRRCWRSRRSTPGRCCS